METINRDKSKRYPPGTTLSILLCALAALYYGIGLKVVPALTVIGQVYFIYASRLWVKRYGGKRNFDVAHSLFHLGHPRWVTDWGITLFTAGFYLGPLIMLIQSFWQDTHDTVHRAIWWMVNAFSVAYYVYLVCVCTRKDSN